MRVFFDANYERGDGDYDDDDDAIFHATQTNTQFVDSVLINKNCWLLADIFHATQAKTQFVDSVLYAKNCWFLPFEGPE